MSGEMRRGTRVRDGAIRFRFDGREYVCQPGDTAASALLAQGVRQMGRSVKYRRLRGLLTAGPEEPNALLTVGRPPAVHSQRLGAAARAARGARRCAARTAGPRCRFDLASLLQAGGGFFGAGFYYKTFIWPKWRTYEPLIRRLAGLGEAPRACELPPVAVEHLSCDVLVAGAGPAGLAAALAAARAGARVVLCEREPVCGGELEFEGGSIDGQAALRGWRATLAELERCGARVLTNTALVGGTGGQLVAARRAGRLAGSERSVPGSAARIRHRDGRRRAPDRLRRQRSSRASCCSARPSATWPAMACAPAREAVLFGNHDRLYAAAARLSSGGMRVRAIVDSRSDLHAAAGGTAALRDAAARSGTLCLAGSAVTSVVGGRRMRGVRVAPLAGAGPPRAHQLRHTAAKRRMVAERSGRAAGRRRTRVRASPRSLSRHRATAVAHAGRRRQRPPGIGRGVGGRPCGGRPGRAVRGSRSRRRRRGTRARRRSAAARAVLA